MKQVGVCGSLVVCLLLAGCANSDGIASDGRPIDAAGPIDGPLDGAVAQVYQPGAELVVASGRVGAGAVTIDVEVGHWLEPGETAVGTRRLVGAAVVFP